MVIFLLLHIILLLKATDLSVSNLFLFLFLTEDLMLNDGGSLSDIRTIVEKLAMQLVDWSAGNDLLFNFSMFYFHFACKDVAGNFEKQIGE